MNKNKTLLTSRRWRCTPKFSATVLRLGPNARAHECKADSYLGYRMVKKIPFLAVADEIVYCHHERFDGTGYVSAMMKVFDARKTFTGVR